MADSETQAEQPSAPATAGSARPRRKTTRKKTSGDRKTGARRSPARRKPARKTARRRASVAALLEGFASRAAKAGSGLAALSGEGAEAARKALSKAGAASQKAIRGLTKEWKGMDTQRKVQVVAAVLGALAAASAPFVRGRRKK